MSQIDDIKEKVKAQFQRLLQSVQETESYNQLQDRYQSLSPSSQKLVLFAGSALVLLLVLFSPLSQISNSQSMINSFEEKRTLIRDLFRTYREATGQASVPVPPPLESLKMNVENVLNSANLIPEQKVGIIQTMAEGRLIPENLVGAVLEVKLAKLNLKQIVDIGASLVGISESVKMKDLTMTANSKDTRYFDVTYKLYSLKVPEVAPEPPPEIEAKPAKKGGAASKDPKDKNKKSGDDE